MSALDTPASPRRSSRAAGLAAMLGLAAILSIAVVRFARAIEASFGAAAHATPRALADSFLDGLGAVVLQGSIALICIIVSLVALTTARRGERDPRAAFGLAAGLGVFFLTVIGSPLLWLLGVGMVMSGGIR